MINITLDNPFLFNLEILEIDDKIPSFKVNCAFEVKSLKGYIKNSISYWISNQSWDSFIHGFDSSDKASLIDLSEIVRIKIYPIDNKFQIFFDNSFQGNINAVISFDSIIEKEIAISIIQKFKDFPKWW